MWSEIVVTNWTWHNPGGFEDDLQSFVLRIDRMTLRLELGSILDALLFKRAVNVNLALFEGVHFKTRRNHKGELNLWSAINEPDQDTNINAIWSRARAQGGLDGGPAVAAAAQGSGSQGSSPGRGGAADDDLGATLLQPLPAVSTSATRKAARYWRPEWGSCLPVGEKCSWMWGDLKAFAAINPLKRSSMMSAQALALELYLVSADERRRPVCVTASGGSRWSFESVDEALTFLSNFTDEDDTDDEGNGVAKGYVEFPIGDPRRRPRWGVPLRLDIQQVVALHLRVELFDLLTLNAHNAGMYAWMWGDINIFGVINPVRWSEYRTALPLIADIRRESAHCPNRPVTIKGRDFADIMTFETVELAVQELQRRAAEMSPGTSGDSKTIDVKYLTVDRDRLEQGDPRRSGSDDNVHGVYLGELVWVIIAEAVPIILKSSPSRLMRNVLSASAYDMKDASVRATARALEGLHTIGSTFGDTFGTRSTTCPELGEADCRLRVHLIKGRKITNRNGHRVNVLAKLALTEPGAPPGEHVSRASSSLKLWTMDPCWSQRFELGPVSLACCSLRLALFHRRTKQFAKLEERTDDKIGEIVVSLLQLLGSEQTIGEDGERCGWFPITAADGEDRDAGEVKLGLRLVNAASLPDRLLHDHSECVQTVEAAKRAAEDRSFLGASQVLVQGGRAYSWMWGDARSLARINPVRWSDWSAPEKLSEELARITDPQERQRPVRVKGKQRGHWTFSTVPMAVEWLKSAGTSPMTVSTF